MSRIQFTAKEEASGFADAMRSRLRYKVVRGYFRGGRRTIVRGLTLAEAQEWCSNPETSSRTCTKAVNRARTRRMGPWFDGYEQD